MKLKLKLDKKTLQEFFIEQSEKVAFGAVVVLVLLVVYFALAHGERYGRTPAQLIKAALQGEEQMKQSPPEPGVTVADYVSKARRSRVRIEEKPYAYTALFDSPLFPQKGLRNVPAIYAVQQLRGAAERGAFRIATKEAAARNEPARPPRGDRRPTAVAAANRPTEEIRGQRWVSLVALVPVEKQLTAFKEALSGTVFSDPQRDVPEYLGFWVERVEVASPGEAADPNWEKPTTFNLQQAVRNAEDEWPQSVTQRGSDVVPEKYLDELLVFPLGPLVDRPWGPNQAHGPEIPIKKLDVLRADGGVEGGGIRDPRRRLPGPGADGEVAAPGDSPFDVPEPKSDRPNKTPAPKDVRPAEEDKAPEYKLCRFFDYTVEPGKHYVYRICVALRNPNYELKPALLKKPELAKDKYLKTNWSEPSPVISVPRDVSVLAVSVKPPLRQAGEPSGRVLVTRWVHRKGLEAFKEFSVVRGQVANFLDETFKPPRTAIHAGRGAIGGDVTAGTTKSIKLNFVADATTIDLRGGGRLPGKRGSDPMFEPGEVLLLDSDGTLAVRNEMEDLPVVEDLTSAGQEPEQPEGMTPGGLTSGPSSTSALEKMFDGTSKKKPPKKKINNE
jgi:hypothetical protein